jgi:hypothetical protein
MRSSVIGPQTFGTNECCEGCDVQREKTGETKEGTKERVKARSDIGWVALRTVYFYTMMDSASSVISWIHRELDFHQRNQTVQLSDYPKLVSFTLKIRQCGTVTNQELVQLHGVDFYSCSGIREGSSVALLRIRLRLAVGGG